MFEIPLIDLQAQYASIRDEVDAAIARVLERQSFIGGPETAAFESEYAQFCGASHCVAVSSGTAALELVLEALGVGPGDEVITVSHTFFATVSAVLRRGAVPVFVDVGPDDWTMAPDLVAEAVSARTKAIVPVHIYGHPCDVPAIAEAAPGIPIVEDAAQAHGARYHGLAIGTGASAACFSFYPGKNLGAYGDAGAVITDDALLAKRVHALRNHGRANEKYEHRSLGTNARASELQMAVLRAKLPHLRRWTELRRSLSLMYELRLALDPSQYQKNQPWAEHARHLFVVRVPQRDRVVGALHSRGIQAGIHYPIPCHRQGALKKLAWRSVPAQLEVTDRVAAECISLPLYPELGADGVERVSAALESALRTSRRGPVQEAVRTVAINAARGSVMKQ
jgi:dTDP-4-amino-4,6-dideoxygalactose transaminase